MIHSNHIETVDNGDSYTFKFKFGSDKVSLPNEIVEKSFNVPKMDAVLNAQKDAALKSLEQYEADEIARLAAAQEAEKKRLEALAKAQAEKEKTDTKNETAQVGTVS